MRALLALLLLATPALANEVLEQGKADFVHLCAPCHGENAKGDGPQAAHLAKKPADLTMVTAKYGRFPEDRIFETIAGIDMPQGHGTREMPIWGNRYKQVPPALGEKRAHARIDGLVRWLETIQVP